jgi:hypothetical protein
LVYFYYTTYMSLSDRRRRKKREREAQDGILRGAIHRPSGLVRGDA